LNLRAFVSQRLIPTVDGKRCAAIEILIGTPLICDMVRRGDISGIKEVMEKSANLGMQTFDMALFDLYKEGKISLDEALLNADSANNLRLKISLSENASARDTGLNLELTDSEAEDTHRAAPAKPAAAAESTPKPMTCAGLSLQE